MTDQFEQETVENIFKLLGADISNGKIYKTMRGALAMVGASQFVVSHQQKETIVTKNENGNDYIAFGCGVIFRPNFGKKHIKFFVSYDYGEDLFSLNVLKVWGAKSKLIKSHDSIYFDDLSNIINKTYDELIKSECNGFISI